VIKLIEEKEIRCKLCYQKYETQEEADQCIKKFGLPKPKFTLNDRVIMRDQYNKTERIGIITNLNFARPGSSHVPHAIIYLIKLEAENGQLLDQTKPKRSTAQESELEPISMPDKQ